MIGDRRTRLGAEKIDRLMFLRKNLTSLKTMFDSKNDSTSTTTVSKRKPIDTFEEDSDDYYGIFKKVKADEEDEFHLLSDNYQSDKENSEAEQKSQKLSSDSCLAWKTGSKKKERSTVELPLMTHLSSSHTDERDNEYRNALQKANNHFKQENYSNKIDTIHFTTSLEETTKQFNQYQTVFYAGQRLLINRSLDNFTRKSIKPYFNASSSSQFLHQTYFKSIAKRLYYSDISLSMISKYQTKQDMNSSIKLLLRSMDNKNNYSSKLVIEYESILNKQNSLSSLRNDSKDKEESAIIEIEHQSYNSIISSIDLSKPLEKSYSSPLPINAKHFYNNNNNNNNNNLQSAHFIDQYSKDRSELSLDSSMNEIENNQS
ncbi:unnamed protein product, partial [Rotaria magnacalcarata]